MYKLCPHKFNSSLYEQSQIDRDMSKCEKESCQLWWKCKSPEDRTATEIKILSDEIVDNAVRQRKYIIKMIKKEIKLYKGD